MTCSKCNTYKAELEKYKNKYETAKSGLTKEERKLLIELICEKQLTHIIPNEGYNSYTHNLLEQLKAKIRVI
jgi:hypothetical protein